VQRCLEISAGVAAKLFPAASSIRTDIAQLLAPLDAGEEFGRLDGTDHGKRSSDHNSCTVFRMWTVAALLSI